SADMPARAPPGPAAGEEPPGRAEAVSLPHARPGRDARPLQGDRGRPRRPAARLRRLVRHALVPPVPAAAPDAEAACRDRLDDVALLPPRHRRARDARPPAAARGRMRARAAIAIGLVGLAACTASDVYLNTVDEYTSGVDVGLVAWNLLPFGILAGVVAV